MGQDRMGRGGRRGGCVLEPPLLIVGAESTPSLRPSFPKPMASVTSLLAVQASSCHGLFIREVGRGVPAPSLSPIPLVVPVLPC